MKEIESSHGKGILFILDGWDELPEDVSGHDTIYNIINGETLPDCDIVITSRPTSSASLHDTDLISSRIEILGFTPGELQEFFVITPPYKLVILVRPGERLLEYVNYTCSVTLQVR